MDIKGEELRDIMHKAINVYGHVSKEVLIASQNLDEYMNECYYRNNY